MEINNLDRDTTERLCCICNRYSVEPAEAMALAISMLYLDLLKAGMKPREHLRKVGEDGQTA